MLRHNRRLGASTLAAGVLVVVVAAAQLRVDLSTLWAERTQRLASDIGASPFPPKLGGGVLTTPARLSPETLEM